MRKVVDSNYLQSNDLIEYLSNKSNQVVVTDQVSYESLASDYLKSLRILSKYPKQILILKRTETIYKMSLKGAGLQNRMIDFGEIKRFSKLSRKITDPSKRDTDFINNMSAAQQEVKNDLERIRSQTSGINILIGEFFSGMTKEQANTFRKGPPYEKEVLLSIHLNILGIAEKAFDNNTMFRKPDNVRELENSYIYRSLACAYFLFMDWYLKGGLKHVKEKKLINDMFDSQIATYATYFDGLLTNDIKANRSYNTLRYFLKNTSEEIYA